jgi:hypothetical protein
MNSIVLLIIMSTLFCFFVKKVTCIIFCKSINDSLLFDYYRLLVAGFTIPLRQNTLNMKKYLFSFSLLMTIMGIVQAQPGVASLMFVGFNADGTDGVAFVALEDVAAGTTIYFTDNEWDGAAFETGESYWQWSSGATLVAGTVVTISEINQGTLSAGSANPNSTVGTVTWSTTSAPDNNSNISDMNEAVYMYLADTYNEPTLFITAIANSNFNPTVGELDGTGLTEGVNAVQLLGNADVEVYTGPIECGSTIEECIANLVDPDNWDDDNSPGDDSMDGGIDFPGSVAASIILPANCDVPTGLTVTGITSTSAILSWNAVDGAVGYTLQFENDLTGPNYRLSLPAEVTSINPKKFKISAGNTYVWAVKTNCASLNSDWSEPSYFTTPLRLAGEVTDLAVVYPNPSNGQFSVRFPENVTGDASVQVMDMSGKVVAQYTVTEDMISQPLVIDIHVPGIYNVLIATGTTSFMERLIIQ